MKQITKLNRIMTKANPDFDATYFDSYEFMHKTNGMNEALLWLWNDNMKHFDTLGEAYNFNYFCQHVAFLIDETAHEVSRYLIGMYRDIFTINTNFGLNHIEPTNH